MVETWEAVKIDVIRKGRGHCNGHLRMSTFQINTYLAYYAESYGDGIFSPSIQRLRQSILS